MCTFYIVFIKRCVLLPFLGIFASRLVAYFHNTFVILWKNLSCLTIYMAICAFLLGKKNCFISLLSKKKKNYFSMSGSGSDLLSRVQWTLIRSCFWCGGKIRVQDWTGLVVRLKKDGAPWVVFILRFSAFRKSFRRYNIVRPHVCTSPTCYPRRDDEILGNRDVCPIQIFIIITNLRGYICLRFLAAPSRSKTLVVGLSVCRSVGWRGLWKSDLVTLVTVMTVVTVVPAVPVVPTKNHKKIIICFLSHIFPSTTLFFTKKSCDSFNSDDSDGKGGGGEGRGGKLLFFFFFFFF